VLAAGNDPRDVPSADAPKIEREPGRRPLGRGDNREAPAINQDRATNHEDGVARVEVNRAAEVRRPIE